MPVKRGKDGRFAPNGGRARDKGKKPAGKLTKSGFDRWMGAKDRTAAKKSTKDEASFNRWADAKDRTAAKAKSAKPSGISNPNAAKMTSADKVKAAAIMYGTGSKQHAAAKKKFSTKKGK